MEYFYQLLEQVTTGTDSSLVLFFVIMAALVLPLYVLLIKDRKSTREHEVKKREHESQKHDKYIEREREIINVMRETSAVIAENTVVTAGLKMLLEGHGTSFKNILETHGVGIRDGLKRIHERLDMIIADSAEVKASANTAEKAVLAALKIEKLSLSQEAPL